MNTLSFSTAQPGSAFSRAEASGLHIGQTAVVAIVTGVTRQHDPVHGKEVVTAHFCSSIWRYCRRLEVPPPADEVMGVGILGEVAPIPSHAFLSGTFTVTRGKNSLLLSEPRLLRVAPIPTRFLEATPWGQIGGAERVAQFYGFESPEQWLEERGVRLN